MSADRADLPRNYPLLAAGVLSFIFGPGHIIWGQQHVIEKLRLASVDEGLVSLVAMGWALPAVTTILFGVAFVLLSLRFLSTDARPLGWLFVAINAGRYAVLLGTAMSAPGYDTQTLVGQSAGVFMYVAVVVWAIRREKALRSVP